LCSREKYLAHEEYHFQQKATSKQVESCLLVFAEMFSLTLKMEAICSSETSVETRRTIRRDIPEDDTPHNHRCENLKSYNILPMLGTETGPSSP
jgi:hypothetical protein